MFNKIISLLKGRASPTSESLVPTSEVDSELDDKFWKLLHDETLSEEEEMNLVDEITSEFANGSALSDKI